MRIEEFDQRDFLRPPPAFELLFTVDRFLNVIERLPIQQTLDLIFVRESFDAVEFVLEDTFVQVACHADVEGSREAAHDVRTVGFSILGHGRG